MYRVGTHSSRVLRASAPKGAKFSSTDSTKPPPIRRRVPLERLGDVVIPSAQEIRNLKTREYKADISYLKNAPARSLAGRLTQLGAGNNVQSSKPDKQASGPQDAPPQAIAISRERIDALTTKRREARLARQSNQANNPARPGRRPVQPGAQKESTSEPAEVAAARLKSALESAARRREERLRRAKEGQHAASSSKPQARRPKPVAAVIEGSEDFDDNLIKPNESDELDYLPQFPGPEPVSLHLLEAFQSTVKSATVHLVAKGGDIILPSYRASPFLGGEYSGYVGVGSKDYSHTVEELGPVKLAQLTLSHQPDVSMQQRKHALDIVSHSITPASRQRQVA